MGDKLIAACGLICSECDAYRATQKGDADAIANVAAQWSEQYGSAIPPESVWCDGCMANGERLCGHGGECKIRSCVVERGLGTCAGCDDYACGLLQEFFAMAAESGARETLEQLRADR